jgi:hypothetical protein
MIQQFKVHVLPPNKKNNYYVAETSRSKLKQKSYKKARKVRHSVQSYSSSASDNSLPQTSSSKWTG